MEKRNGLTSAVLTACCMFGGAAYADHPADWHRGAPVDIVGAWKMMFQFTSCDTGLPLPTRPAFPALNTFFDDGNLIESASGLSPANRTMSQGRWQQIGKRTVIARSELQLFEGGPTYTGYQILERVFTLSANGSELTSTVAWTRFSPDDALTRSGCATETGKRQPEPEPTLP